MWEVRNGGAQKDNSIWRHPEGTGHSGLTWRWRCPCHQGQDVTSAVGVDLLVSQGEGIREKSQLIKVHVVMGFPMKRAQAHSILGFLSSELQGQRLEAIGISVQKKIGMSPAAPNPSRVHHFPEWRPNRSGPCLPVHPYLPHFPSINLPILREMNSSP